MSNESYSNLDQANDLDFVNTLPHEKIENRILSLIMREKYGVLLAIDENYYDRNKHVILKEVIEEIFLDDSLCPMVFPETVNDKTNAVEYVKTKSLLRQYLELKIVKCFEKSGVKKGPQTLKVSEQQIKLKIEDRIGEIERIIKLGQGELSIEQNNLKKLFIDEIKDYQELSLNIFEFIKKSDFFKLLKELLGNEFESRLDVILGETMNFPEIQAATKALFARIKEEKKILDVARFHAGLRTKKVLGDIQKPKDKEIEIVLKSIAVPLGDNVKAPTPKNVPVIPVQLNTVDTSSAVKRNEVTFSLDDISGIRTFESAEFPSAPISAVAGLSARSDFDDEVEVTIPNRRLDVDFVEEPTLIPTPVTVKDNSARSSFLQTLGLRIQQQNQATIEKVEALKAAAAQKAAEDANKAEETRKEAEEKAKRDALEAKRALEEAKQLEEARIKREKETAKRIAEEAKRKEEEKAKQAAAYAKKLEELRISEEAKRAAKAAAIAASLQQPKIQPAAPVSPITSVLPKTVKPVSAKVEQQIIPEPVPTPAIDDLSAEEKADYTPPSKIGGWFQKNLMRLGVAVGLLGIAIGGAKIFTSKKADKESQKTTVAFQANNFAKKTIDTTKVPDEIQKAQDSLDAAVTVMQAEPVKPVVSEPIKVAEKPANKEVKQVKPPVAEPRTAEPKVDPKPAPVAPVAPEQDTFASVTDSTYREMWEGKTFELKGRTYSEQLQKGLLKQIKLIKDKKARNQAMQKFNEKWEELEKGWLLYMSLEGQNDWWAKYQQEYKGRAKQAKQLVKKYQELSNNKTEKDYKEIMNLLDFGRDFMKKGQESSNEVDLNQAKSGKFNNNPALKLIAEACGLPMPKAPQGTTGELHKAPVTDSPEVMLAAVNIELSPDNLPSNDINTDNAPTVDNDQIISAVPMWGAAPYYELKPILKDLMLKHPPVIPKDARVTNKDAEFTELTDNDIYEIHIPKVPINAILNSKPLPDNMAGAAPAPVLKPILGDMMKKHPPVIPKNARVTEIKDSDIYDLRELGVPPAIPESARIDEITDDDIIAEVPMYGASTLPEKIGPILAKMDKKRLERNIPRGESATIVPHYVEVSHDAKKISTQPPVPQIAEIKLEKQEKKSLWGKVKGWFSRAA